MGHTRAEAPTPRRWRKKSGRGYGVPGSSAVVSDLRTNEACGRLTSQIGRDMLHSAKHGRTQHPRKRTHFVPRGVPGAPLPAPPAPGVNFQFCECRAFPAPVLYWVSSRWY
ncbi:uncharacterized protein TM35_000102670 [Trypanosoma theileri]|uniref:Uncharacterized protein n=1 Tax=Trypanosoma theileri TaxID=67003 RepID=A0A1X0P0H1_9TRYP|nr:uncharacterized protein TM35_000102670 [Trypanosoma theileri]ORC89999.1 hypothetical protein TM35_000102670 [Trypanosoma theileri]